ncbi:pilus assembly protein FilA [Acinetobacter johnsonii]|nr:pilus assembly protein FilA [Acinetobacter johnsonii]
MKIITKLALVSSMAISANAMAMQAMDDASLSAATGQDGLNIGIGISKIEIGKVFVHDNDGLATTSLGGTSTAGAIVIQGNGIAGDTLENHGIVIGANYDNAGAYLLPSRNLADLQIDTDANGGNAFINIAAQVSGLDIKIGQIGVVASGDLPAAGATSIRRGGSSTSTVNPILSGLSLKTGPMSANIQLGAAPQGAMIQLSATMVGGLEIKNLGILDNSTKTATRAAGEIFVESIKVADANSLDLTLNQKISVIGEEGANKGYIRMISTSGAHDTYVKGVHLGSRNAASIGDVEVQGMQTYFSPAAGVYMPGAVITISGH